ncbi:hypothetical protein [Dyadobacter sandarakinus]|uniref:Uncharacterized protein n=1 Tax=Dyadobacter sandarakinus TaxID=2747268 RepID=A0ABX7I1F4_9BACT|nr:hypothetical protein [Dyadobacter sandarakinus]QRQ99517.1 hypothetical protein HWI92_00610 [Dyadobacter sandarakinus]
MYNQTTEADSADARSDDAEILAYGRQVKELLSASPADTWCEHLWAMYGGYVLAQKELGYNAQTADVFWSFRDLLFFFQEKRGRD